MDRTLMLGRDRWHLDVHVWPHGWSRAAKRRWWETLTLQLQRDHLGIRRYFPSLFHVRCLCAPSVCLFEWRQNDRFPLRTWHITLMPGRPAGWEKTAAARHSSQPHQSPGRQTWRPWAPWKTCSLTCLLSVTRQRETDWMTDWGGKYAEHQADAILMDRCVGEHWIMWFFYFFHTFVVCHIRKLLFSLQIVYFCRSTNTDASMCSSTTAEFGETDGQQSDFFLNKHISKQIPLLLLLRFGLQPSPMRPSAAGFLSCHVI